MRVFVCGSVDTAVVQSRARPPPGASKLGARGDSPPRSSNIADSTDSLSDHDMPGGRAAPAAAPKPAGPPPGARATAPAPAAIGRSAAPTTTSGSMVAAAMNASETSSEDEAEDSSAAVMPKTG